MRIAWLSPLPPIASGIGEYSLQLLPLVAEHAEVTAVSPRPGRFKRVVVPEGIRWETPNAWAAQVGRYDASVYHLGNNLFHQFAYDAALEHPSISMFHDIVLHHMLADVLVERGQNDYMGYEKVLRSEHGAVGTRLAQLRLKGMASDLEKFLFPLFAHVAARSRAVIVHSEEMKDRMLQQVADVPITVIPHFAPSRPPEVASLTRESARRMFGLPLDAFIVGCLGYVTLPKQPEAIIGGFRRLLERNPKAMLAIVGKDHTGGRLQRWLDQPGLAGRVRLTGFVDLIRFYQYLIAVDAVVNLRYPTVVETSGTNARALAEGRPLIVSNVGAFAELPDAAVCKVEIDEDQAEAVGRHLIRIAEDDQFRAGLVENGLRYADTYLHPRRCADLYVQVAREVAGLSRRAG